MKTKSSFRCLAMVFVLTALVAMNGEAQNAARDPGLYADDVFIGDATLSEAAEKGYSAIVEGNFIKGGEK